MRYNKVVMSPTQMKAPASEKVRFLKYEALRRSLQETVEEWPHLYEHKIIGKNEDLFRVSVSHFEQKFPRLNKKSSQVSRKGNYLSITYEILARDVDEIINLWVASEQMNDLVTIL